MKIHRENRIINVNNTITSISSNIGLIFIASMYKTLDTPKKIQTETKFKTINNIISNKKLKLNKTKLYHKDDNYITIVNSEKWDTSILENIIDIKNILNIIDIYNNKLFIIHVDYNTKINGYLETNYLDLFTILSSSLYNDIYFYNKFNILNCYLSNVLTDRNNNYKLKIIDLYYYLIGYI